MAKRWATYHKPSIEQVAAMTAWFETNEVPQVLRSVIRQKFCRLNYAPERIANTTARELLEATP